MNRPPLRLLAIDDDPGDLVILGRYLENLESYDVLLAARHDAGDLLAEARRGDYDAIFLDYRLGAATGLDMLRNLREAGVRTPVVMLTGHGDEQLAVELMKAGATDYLGKSRLAPDRLCQVLRNALRIGALERRAAEAEQKLRLAATVFDNILEGVMVTDSAGTLVSVNPAFSGITGYAPGEILGRTPGVLRSGRHDQAFYQHMWAALLGPGKWSGEIWNRRKNGEVFPAWQTIAAVRDDSGQTCHYVSVFQDITERKRREAAVQHQAYHDPLTGLANRHLLRERLAEAMRHARREGDAAALMYLDLDHFKAVNDRHGHAVGDALLREVARRLLAGVRQEDTVARLGGDEFVLLLPRIHSRRQAERLAQKLVESFDAPLDLEGVRLEVGVSIGVAFFPRDADDADSLMARADTAMYRAKQAGRHGYRFADDAPARLD